MEQNDKDKRGKEFIKNYLKENLAIYLVKESTEDGLRIEMRVDLEGEIIDADYVVIKSKIS